MQCFSSKNLLTEYKYKEVYWSINGARSVILENGTIEFENYFKQIPVPLKFDADFECNFKRVQRSLHKITFLAVSLTNLFVLMMILLSQ